MPWNSKEKLNDGDLVIMPTRDEYFEHLDIDAPHRYGVWLHRYIKPESAPDGGYEPIAWFVTQSAAFEFAISMTDDITVWLEEDGI